MSHILCGLCFTFGMLTSQCFVVYRNWQFGDTVANVFTAAAYLAPVYLIFIIRFYAMLKSFALHFNLVTIQLKIKLYENIQYYYD